MALEGEDFARCELLDTAFHETLIELSGNKYLIDSYRTISDKIRALRSRLPQTHERVAGAITQHRRIVDLIALGKPEAAADEFRSMSAMCTRCCCLLGRGWWRETFFSRRSDRQAEQAAAREGEAPALVTSAHVRPFVRG